MQRVSNKHRAPERLYAEQGKVLAPSEKGIGQSYSLLTLWSTEIQVSPQLTFFALHICGYLVRKAGRYPTCNYAWLCCQSM